jgi:hypothetical protein
MAIPFYFIFFFYFHVKGQAALHFFDECGAHTPFFLKKNFYSIFFISFILFSNSFLFLFSFYLLILFLSFGL